MIKNKLLMDLLHCSDKVKFMYYSTDISSLKENEVIMELTDGRYFKTSIEECKKNKIDILG